MRATVFYFILASFILPVSGRTAGENPTAIHDWVESSKEKFKKNNAEEAEGSEGQKKGSYSQ